MGDFHLIDAEDTSRSKADIVTAGCRVLIVIPCEVESYRGRKAGTSSSALIVEIFEMSLLI